MTRLLEIMSCKLPEDLEIEILSRLPVKSLLRFNCVCKSWYVLIKSPRFIYKHLHLSRTSSRYIYNDSYLLVLCSYDHTFDYFATILSSETLGVSREVGSLNLTDLFTVGSCNGLVCISNYHTVGIYNLATREVKSLPIPPYITGQPHVTTKTRYLGFGFDPKMNDYKVVRIVELIYKETLWRLPNVVQICMLRSGSWRDTELVLPARIIGPSRFNTYINGTFNWLARDFGSGMINEIMILSFHMSDEVFETIKIPFFLWEGHDVSLALWNGSFALIRSPFKRRGIRPPSTPTYFEIWAMNQSRLEEAWVKQVAVGPIAGVERPVAILGIDKLFLESGEGELISCDLRTQEIRNHQIYGGIHSMQVGIYNESLTSVE